MRCAQCGGSWTAPENSTRPLQKCPFCGAALERAEICEYAVCVEVTIAVNYPEVNALTRFLEGENVLNREFAEKASFTVAVREERVDDFCARCNDMLIGRAEILRGKSYFSPFPLDK